MVAWAKVPVHVVLSLHEPHGDHVVEFDSSYMVGGRLTVDASGAHLNRNPETGKDTLVKEMSLLMDPMRMQVTGNDDKKGEVVMKLLLLRLQVNMEGLRQFKADGVAPE